MYGLDCEKIKGIGEIREKSDFTVTREQDTTDGSDRVILHVTDKQTQDAGFLIVRRLINGGTSEAGKFYLNTTCGQSLHCSGLDVS